MKEQHLYQQIIQSVREEILSGRIKPGDRLPSIRVMTETWHCTPGTVQRAYRELSAQGLVISRAGQGTHVSGDIGSVDETPLRRARLVHRAQEFLLEVLTAGFTPDEVEIALRLALDQWRVIRQEASPPVRGTLRFSGSHDLAIAWIAAHFSEIAPHFSLDLNFTGSLGGLIELAEGKVQIAGCHLWDQETESYNVPFVRKLFPGRRAALLTLAWRYQGLMTHPSNPIKARTLQDLTRPRVRFINRQTGSGTRVWLDATLHKLGIQPEGISGYEVECQTHSDVARAVAEGQADVGFGVQTAAQTFGLDFVPLVKERYDLVILENELVLEPVQMFIEWLQTKNARDALTELGGYDTENTGTLVWVG